MIGYKPGKPMTKLRRCLVLSPKIIALDRIVLFILGIVWIDLSRPKIDYT
jgi:hypothetical protein